MAAAEAAERHASVAVAVTSGLTPEGAKLLADDPLAFAAAAMAAANKSVVASQETGRVASAIGASLSGLTPEGAKSLANDPQALVAAAMAAATRAGIVTEVVDATEDGGSK